jgi:hypothetical protein
MGKLQAVQGDGPMAKRKHDRDTHVDEQGAESFPASDPPAFNAGERIGEPRRESEKIGRPQVKPAK